MPEKQFDDDDDKVIKKRQRYIKIFKYVAWNRCNKEYLRSLREKLNMKNKQRHIKIAIIDVVLIKGKDKDMSKWNIDIVEELYEEKDNIIKAVKFRSRKINLEPLIQLLYPIESSCDAWKRKKGSDQFVWYSLV